MQGLTEVAPPGFGHTKSGKGDEMYECYLDEDFKQFPEKKVSRKIQREKDKLSAGDLAGTKASGSQIQGRQQQLNRKRAGRIMKMSRAMNSKTSTSSNERMKMNSSAQKTTRTVDRIKDRQTGSDTYKGRPRRWSLEPKLKDKKKEIKEVWGAVNEVAPPGFGHTKSGKGAEKGGTSAAFDRARKEGRFKGSKSDMFAIMWSQKNKGDKPHYKPGTNKKYKKYQEEETSMLNVSKKDKGAIKKRYKNLFTRDISGTKQGVNESLSGKDAKKLEKASVFSYSDDPKKQDIARTKQVEVDYKDLIRQLKSKKKKSGNTNVNESYEIGEASYSDWRKKATDAVKKVAGKKTIKKHEYPGRDAGKEAKQRLSKRDHETVNFLDPDD